MGCKLKAQDAQHKASERRIFRLEAELRIARQRQLAGGACDSAARAFMVDRPAAHAVNGGVLSARKAPRDSVGKRSPAARRLGGALPLAAKENTLGEM